MSKNLIRSLLLVIVGLASGVALVVACGDDTVAPSDAATPCNCEAPLAGRIVYVTDQVSFQSAGSTKGAQAICPFGATLLGGGCELLNSSSGIYLITSMPFQEVGQISPGVFACVAESTVGPTDATLVATAICLNPASM